MLVALSPAAINFTETLSTLKYANRAKSIKVNAQKNEEASQVTKLNDEIAELKMRLQEQQKNDDETSDVAMKYEKQIKEIEAIRMQTWEDKMKLSKQHEAERRKLAKEKALADKQIKEEKLRKWKLLQEKGDVELILQTLYDHECGQKDWIESYKAINTLRVSDDRERIYPYSSEFIHDLS